MKRTIVLYMLMIVMWAVSGASAYMAYIHLIGATGMGPILSGVFGTLQAIVAVYAFTWPIREVLKDGWPHTW